MKNYLVVFSVKGENATRTEWSYLNNTKKDVKELYRANGYTVSTVLTDKDIQKALNDVEHKHYFLLEDLKGNGVI